jgi:hypothetical protein
MNRFADSDALKKAPASATKGRLNAEMKLRKG